VNIHHFGGDNNKVTLFGYRAGATLVTALSSSPKANKLFARVWASSGSSHFPGNDLKDYELANAEYGNSFPDCKDKKCWQEKNTADLLKMIPSSWKRGFDSLPGETEKSVDFHDWIVLDGVILKRHVEDGWKSAKSLPQIVIGTTAHSIFDPIKQSVFAKNFTEEEIEKYVTDSIIGSKNLTEQVFEKYGKTKEGLVAMISDIRTVCPLSVQAGSQPDITFYVATQTGDENLSSVDVDVQAILGRYHAATPEKRRYLDAISKLFYHYVYHGKIHHITHNKILEIGQDVFSKDIYKNCDFWIKNDIVPHYAAH
jgi:carboxylesterase type B